MNSRRQACAWTWLVIATGACSTTEEHAPFCYESRCTPSVNVRVNSADAGVDNNGVPTAGAASTLTIQAQIMEAVEFSYVREATGSFNVSAPTVNGELVQEQVGSVFSLSGVLASRMAWISASPVNQLDLMPGLAQFDATSARVSAVEIPLVRRSDLQLVASSLTGMVLLDESKAQVVVQLVDSRGDPVSGITVQMAGATVRAYDLGAGYTDDAAATGARGLAFLLNVDASSTPALRTLTLSGVVSAEVAVLVQAGAATMLTLMASTT